MICLPSQPLWLGWIIYTDASEFSEQSDTQKDSKIKTYFSLSVADNALCIIQASPRRYMNRSH